MAGDRHNDTDDTELITMKCAYSSKLLRAPRKRSNLSELGAGAGRIVCWADARVLDSLRLCVSFFVRVGIDIAHTTSVLDSFGAHIIICALARPLSRRWAFMAKLWVCVRMRVCVCLRE